MEGARRDVRPRPPASLLVFLAAAPFRGARHRAQVGHRFPRLHGLVLLCGRPCRQRFPWGRIMTQTLDMNERVSQRGSFRAASAPASTRAEVSKIGTFAVTFGIAF